MQRPELVSVGSDPELFLEDFSGKVISAIGKIGGTKDKPRPIKELGKGYAVQEDNVLLEYNTPPVRGLAQWNGVHDRMRIYLQSMVGQLKLKLSTKASHSMTEDQLNHPLAFVFGCDPDYNVWKMKWNPKPKCDDPFLRSAGGHVHVSYTNPNQADSIRLGRLMDFFIGAPLAVLDPDKKRRLLYGRPGAIRFKPYGLEYRTPSNFWTLDPQRVEAVYSNVNECVSMLKSYDNFAKMAETARDFLEGKEEGWNDEYFRSRGCAYTHTEPKKKISPSIYFENLQTLKMTPMQFTPADIAQALDEWTMDSPPPEVSDEDQEDEA